MLEWLEPVSPAHFLLPPPNSRITVLACLTRAAYLCTERFAPELVVFLRFPKCQKFLESLPTHSSTLFGWRKGLGIFILSHEARKMAPYTGKAQRETCFSPAHSQWVDLRSHGCWGEMQARFLLIPYIPYAQSLLRHLSSLPWTALSDPSKAAMSVCSTKAGGRRQRRSCRRPQSFAWTLILRYWKGAKDGEALLR